MKNGDILMKKELALGMMRLPVDSENKIVVDLKKK